MNKTNKTIFPPGKAGQGRGQLSRWLWQLAMSFVMLLGTLEVFGQSAVPDFDFDEQSKVHGSTIYTRWSNWLKQHWYKNGNKYVHYDVLRYGAENSFRGWNIDGKDGRPSTWYYYNICGPTINNHVWYGEELSYWFHFKYENIDEITPDHPYVEIWVPNYDKDDSSNSDVTKASALYVTDADGDDVLVGVQQYSQRQIDNYYVSGKNGWFDDKTFLLYEDTPLSYLEQNYNSGDYANNNKYLGILTNWGTFNGANGYHVFGSTPEYVKLRYYPGYNLGESFDLSFIVNWDLNADNNNYSTNDTYNAQFPRFSAEGKVMFKADKSLFSQSWTWSTDWSTMFVTKGIKVNNKVAAPTVERVRNGKIKVSASGVKTYDDFQTSFVLEKVGRLDMGHKASGSATIGNNVDHKQPLRSHSIVYRSTTVKNGSLPMIVGTVQNQNCTYYSGTKDCLEPVVQEFKNAYDVIPGCAYPSGVKVEVNKWKKKAIITWNAVKDNRNTDGRFYVYRYDGNNTTPAVVGSVAVNDVQRLEDIELEYNKHYTYTVAFMLNSWSDTSTPESSLSASTTAETYRKDMLPIELTAVSGENDVTLNWSFPAPQISNGASFKVYRRNTSEQSWTELTSIGTKTANSQTDHLSAVDNTIGSNCESYYYQVRTEIVDTSFVATLAQPIGLSGDGTEITSLTCNHGTYSNMVKVRWQVHQVGTTPTHYVLYRRLMSEGDDAYKSIYECEGTSASYYYEDVTAQPGQYYVYYVKGTTECSSGTLMSTYSASEDGFAQSKGVLSGRVSYGSGTAVEGVKVRLTTDSDAGKAQFYSLYVGGLGNRIEWADETEVPKVLAGNKAFSVQFWMKPDAINLNENTNTAVVMDLGGQTLQYRSDGKLYAVGNGKAIATSEMTLQPNNFYNITYRYDGAGHVTVAIVNGDEVSTFGYNQTITMTENRLTFGAPSGATEAQQFYGNFDDIRVWSTCLTDAEILANYHRILSGQEQKLAVYWPVDEGVPSLKKVYDYSKQGGVANERHAQMTNGVTFSTAIPNSDQLSLYGETDSQGNYVIRGIPFNGDGTNYSVTPLMNSHEFSPQYQARFVSIDALNHSGVDFTDVSSFEVHGIIRYAGTNIPVDSVQISVDGRQAARNNSIVVTDENGEFIVDVPIGRHFISASKDGHTFINEGRIPADPTGLNETSYEFVKPENGFVFWDNTLVPVAGRVVGGAIEGDKPLGFGASRNTIGQAQITLEIPDTHYMLNAYEDTEGLVSNGFKPVSTDTPLTYPTGATATGTGYRTGGTLESQARNVVITTDATTGEFAVLLPPLDYKVTSVKMVNTEADKAYKFPSDQLPSLDVSAPATVLTDSILTDGNYRYFDYVASLKLTKHTDPLLSVRQMLNNKKDVQPEGVFGDEMATYTYRGTNGKEVSKEAVLYTVGTNGKVNYNYGYPIFGSMGEYTFKLEGYELYTNYEMDVDDRVTRVPLQNMVVTIGNAMSANQKVYSAAPENGDNAGKVFDLKDDQLQLDDKGEAVYTWKAGLPNIQGDLTKRLSMTYNNGAGDYSWQGLDGIIFGDLPTGTNFTTKGPQNVQMVLHDPYGDSSFATWESGKATTTTKETLKTGLSENTFSANIHLGPKVELEEGLFVSIQTEIEGIADFEIGYTHTEQHDTVDTRTTTIETTRAVSTSADPDMVGADADIYIGQSENMLFGGARSVGLKGDGVNKPHIEVADAVTVTTKFDTEFFYTQYEIETKIIPDLIRLRNLELTYNANPASVKKNEGDNPLYLTSLKPDDAHYGEAGTYKYLPGKKSCIDMVNYYNDCVKNWKECIKANEKHKLDCFASLNNRDKKNISFGGGVEVTESESKSSIVSHTTTYSYSYISNFGMDLGATLNGVGLDFAYETHGTPTDPMEGEKTGAETDGQETAETATFSYTLADSGADDMFTIDVFKATDNHGPVFRTRGGQSSCPYEGQEVTKYYQPGEELSAATVQIEQPELAVNGDNMLTGVPTGGKAQFELLLMNNSGINADAYFDLVPVDGSNPKGAILSLPTGPIGNGRTVLVPGGETVRMVLTLEQGNLDVTDYEDIKLALKSTCQNDETSIHGAIMSTVSLTAHFVPASTPVNMTIDQTVVNTVNVDNDLAIRVTGFDRNFTGLQRVDLQYVAPGAQSWSLLKSYIPSEKVRTDNSQVLLPGNGVIELPLSMKSSSWSDGTYQFRAQSSAIYGGKPVTSESEVLTVVKDVNRPQLFGLASPSDGVLNSDDEISVTFNEDIQKNLLTKNNFVVSGVLNGAEIQHDVALSAQNTARAAYTEASINLAQKSFSSDMWVRVTSAGDIVTHGNGDEKFKVSVDTKGHLVVTIGSKSYTSTKTIAKNTWTFLAFDYAYESGASVLNARAVTANSTEDLFKNVAVADYAGTGSLALGQNFSGAIHELTLWDKSRGMEEAQAEMYFTKKPSTPNLIGYWKMDEGEGKQIRDYARNRHLTMPNSSWYLNNENKAVTINGNALKLDISACSTLATDDYAVEMWFKGAKADQHAASTLFFAGEESVAMGFSNTGVLTLTAKGSDIEVSKNNYLDNAWHHLALNVLRNGNATVYVDGTPQKTIAASAVPALAGSFLYVGARGTSQQFKGSVDDIRLWKASMTGDLLKSQRTQRLTGKESGLVAYYSFEQTSRDPNSGVISSVGTAKDLCSETLEATTVSGAKLSYSNEAPAMKVKPEATNVEFKYVANERGIIITLNEEPAVLEGTTLNFSVRSVKDMNGNESEAINWTAFVKQNQLVWKDDTEMSIVKQGTERVSFEATFTNDSGNSENWSLSGLPSWLTANTESGTLKAQQSKTITFTVSESLSFGKYETTVYLTGNQNIAAPLTINVKAKGEEPLWSVNEGDYEETMGIIGELRILNVPSRDEDDIVGAFINGECRGVARPKYESRYDGYFVTMDIYGSSDDANLPIELKAFDASTGTIYPVVKLQEYNTTAPSDLKFEANRILGFYGTPTTLAATDEIEQNIALGKGWNWMSLNVQPEESTVPVVFAKAYGKVSTVKDKSSFMAYENNEWSGGLSTMSSTKMYVVQATEAFTMSVTGHPVITADNPISLKKGWNWVGYNAQGLMSVGEALGDMNPQDGDIIKGKRGFAYFDTHAWSGSLTTLEPGKGYKIYTATKRSFSYPNVTATAGARAFSESDDAREPQFFTPIDDSSYPANMLLIAKVVHDGMPVSYAELGVFAGEECRQAAVTDDQGMAYITIPGDEPVKLTFRVADGYSPISILHSRLVFETDGVVGSPRTPFVIELGNVTGIANANADLNEDVIYDLQGRKVRLDDQTRKLRKGVYVINGQKQVK